MAPRSGASRRRSPSAGCDVARIGVLALQGAAAPHVTALRTLGHDASLVRTTEELARIDGLVLPGGESTVMLRLLEREGLDAALDTFVRSGRPTLATCAGLVLAARAVRSPAQRSFGWLDVEVERNAWGNQLDSFEARSDDGRIPLVLIRAPRIVDVGAHVQVLAAYRSEPIAVRERAVVGLTFHPELTPNTAFHALAFGRSRASAA